MKKALNKDTVIISYCTNKRVLDVGCVGQDRSFTNSEWLHLKIKNVAQLIHGVDINTTGILEMNRAGFIAYSASELVQTNNKYDVILMGDVIEHVDNAVLFLDFYKQFLDTNSIIIITTPNALRIDDTLAVLFFNNYYINNEHTCWYCPKTFTELSKRANLKIIRFEWLKHVIVLKKNLISKVFNIIRLFFCFLRPNFNPNMLFILQKNDE